jgi:hypothetical protein
VGADARLFLFDYAAYRDSVVPALLRVLRDGEIEDWLAKIYRDELEEMGRSPEKCNDFEQLKGVDLLKHCTYLDSEFAVQSPVSPGSLYDCAWNVRVCKSLTCLVRDRCPFHARENVWTDGLSEEELLLRLFQRAVIQRCLGAGQFLGRSIDSFFYWESLDALGVHSDSRVHQLLERLGRRAFVVGFQGIAGTDGIHGWLNPEESAELSDRLFALNLPEYERSFAAMESFRSVQNILAGHRLDLEFNALAYNHPDVPFELLSLSFVRTMCSLAVRDGKGVLWGNDIA